MGRLTLFFLGGLWLGTTWAVVMLHRAVAVSPDPARLAREAPARVGWYPRQGHGLNELFVAGAPYARGLAEGRATRTLMESEERGLRDQFQHFFANPILRWGLMLGAMRWFWGLDRYLPSRNLEEMAGVARAASPEFDDMLDPFTRQIAYHGLHEVGQMFVDFRRSDKGCTVFALPAGGSWMVGRNFDFEGGRIFDEEKILKWVLPDEGHRFVAVTWAGMVGIVTGVNDRGVYVSINAAGSTDFRRFGIPTTLVALDAVQFSDHAEEAARRICSAPTFITDIFVVADRERAFRVEKSPRRCVTSELRAPTVVTNHLLADAWKDDGINRFRKRELTSLTRFQRGEALLAKLPPHLSDDRATALTLLGFLRDKRDVAGNALPLGHRSAIDSLIASHSVIYDAGRGLFYVSLGPSLAGGFLGFDLGASFAALERAVPGPGVQVDRLPADPGVSREAYAKIKEAVHREERAESLLRERKCDRALTELAAASVDESSDFFTAMGNAHACRHEMQKARAAWAQALRREPAYAEDRRALEKKLKEGS